MTKPGTEGGKVTEDPGVGQQTQMGVGYVAIGVLIAMVVISIIFAESVAQSAGTTQGKSIGIGLTAFLFFAAAATLGAALGFLFGLPRSRFADQITADQTDASRSRAGSAQVPASTRFLTNTNLIKVSDWLTTIVIGLALVNLGGIRSVVGDLGTALKDPLGGAAYAGAVGVSILLGGVLIGFLLAFLWTSIRYRQLLEESERQLETVPDLVGMTISQANEAMAKRSISLIPHGPDGEDAHIGTQSLNAGANVPRGSRVKVTFRPPPSGGDEVSSAPANKEGLQQHPRQGHQTQKAHGYGSLP